MTLGLGAIGVVAVVLAISAVSALFIAPRIPRADDDLLQLTEADVADERIASIFDQRPRAAGRR